MNNLLRYFREHLEIKIITLILIILVVSFAGIFLIISDKHRDGLIRQEKEKSTFIANIVHETLDKDMMAFRADLVRHLIEDVKRAEGIIRLQIVRGNGDYLGDGRGREEAFQDFTTLDDVKSRIKTLYRKNWETNHPKETKIADGVEHPEFKSYLKYVVDELQKPGIMTTGEKSIREEGKLDRSYFETINGVEALTYLRPLPNFPKCALCHGIGYELRGILMISTSLEGVTAEVHNSQRVLAMLSGITVVILIFLMRLLIRQIVLKPLNEVVERIRDIAEGGGDLTRRIKVGFKDEIGSVAHWVNIFMEKLHSLIQQVSNTAGQVNLSSNEVMEGKSELSDGANVQMKAVQITSSASKEMNLSTRRIADRTETLNELSQESASAILEMSASIDQIAKSSASLTSLVEDTTSALLQMSSSIKQIDENIDSLSANAKESASFMSEMDSSINHIKESVQETVNLSEGVATDAERGRRAVDETAKWIYQIQDYSKQIASIIEMLKAKTGNIGKILEVIDEVADQTNLLSLNAAIIAAQAGEHGKSFSVVAQEIKELSDRTATSTQEIHDIITELQDQSNIAVAAIEQGSSSILEGVELSREATGALEKILESSRRSKERVESIAQTTDEQTGGVKKVTEAMQRISEMVQQIARATHEQSLGSENIISATEKVREVSIKLKGATHEQALGNRHINDITERVNRMIREIAEATSGQTQESENITKAVERIQSVIEQNVDIIKKVGRVIENQKNQAESLSLEINKFKL